MNSVRCASSAPWRGWQVLSQTILNIRALHRSVGKILLASFQRSTRPAAPLAPNPGRPQGKSKARDAQGNIPTYSRQAIHLSDQVRPRRLRGEQERADQENRPRAED